MFKFPDFSWGVGGFDAPEYPVLTPGMRQEGDLCVFLIYFGLIKVVSTRLLFWAHLFFSFLQLPACFSLSIPLNPNPNSPVFTGLGLTLKLSSYNVDFWFFSLILGWFCTNFVSLPRKKMLIFVTLMFPAQLYWGYRSDFEILLPLFNFSLFMEEPKLFLCAELCFHLQWRKNNLGWGRLGAQLFSLIHEGSTGQMVWGIFRSCQDHPALRRHGRRDSPKKKKII